MNTLILKTVKMNSPRSTSLSLSHLHMIPCALSPTRLDTGCHLLCLKRDYKFSSVFSNRTFNRIGYFLYGQEGLRRSGGCR